MNGPRKERVKAACCAGAGAAGGGSAAGAATAIGGLVSAKPELHRNVWYHRHGYCGSVWAAVGLAGYWGYRLIKDRKGPDTSSAAAIPP